MAREFLFSNLKECFAPSDNLSEYGDKDKWRIVSYRANEIKGTMLSSLMECVPRDVSFDPKLTGWYKIYVGLPCINNQIIELKLSQDKSFFRLSPLTQNWLCKNIEEVFWRYAKMDGESLTLSKSNFPGNPRPGMLAWIRFVEMTDEEIARVLRDRQSSETKNLYVTDDIHNCMYECDTSVPGFWNRVAAPYEDSDAEWLSVERTDVFVLGKTPNDRDDLHAFNRVGDRNVQKNAHNFDQIALMKELVDSGHRYNLKMSISLRMGAWGIGYPFDQCYFDYDFFLKNLHLCCKMRHGVNAKALSYAYEEVQNLVLKLLLEMADSGCDAVTLIAHRGIPYLLYEEPIVKLFAERFGFEPYDLPLDDPRLNEIHCEIMTGFFRKLRKALDEAHPERRVEIHLRSLYSLYDTKYIGIDAKKLAEEGLIDAIISYPLSYRETYADGVVKDDGHIDMARYVDSFNDKSFCHFEHRHDFHYVDQMADSRGQLQGPADLASCVKEWTDLEAKTGVRIYFEIMPRIMTADEIRTRALELYDAGITRIGLWDNCLRINYKSMWSIARKLGHKEELRKGIDSGVTIRQVTELAGFDVASYLPAWGG